MHIKKTVKIYLKKLFFLKAIFQITKYNKKNFWIKIQIVTYFSETRNIKKINKKVLKSYLIYRKVY